MAVRFVTQTYQSELERQQVVETDTVVHWKLAGHQPLVYCLHFWLWNPEACLYAALKWSSSAMPGTVPG